ncbi:MAG: hypothetical protein KF721_14145 [Ignavibacteriaceae bacterium]|nr:hypothetical protein [Ignavibacteriaceae bacterium]
MISLAPIDFALPQSSEKTIELHYIIGDFRNYFSRIDSFFCMADEEHSLTFFYNALAILNYNSILSTSCSFLSVRKEPKEAGTVNK